MLLSFYLCLRIVGKAFNTIMEFGENIWNSTGLVKSGTLCFIILNEDAVLIMDLFISPIDMVSQFKSSSNITPRYLADLILFIIILSTFILFRYSVIFFLLVLKIVKQVLDKFTVNLLALNQANSSVITFVIDILSSVGVLSETNALLSSAKSLVLVVTFVAFIVSLV